MANTKAPVVLAGDIGGTKTFLGLFRASGGALKPLREGAYENSAFDSVEALVGDFLGKGGGERIEAGSLGIAGPVVENRSTLTNLGWKIDGDGIAERFGVGRVELINDLVATAWGVGALSGEDLMTLQTGRERSGNTALIAAGTGLGEAAMYWDGSTHIPVGSEAGHADFAPRDKMEIELLEYLLGRWDHISYERVLSGPGLVNIYEFLKKKTGAKEPAYLSERIKKEGAAPAISDEGAKGSDKTCSEALDIFVTIYGAEAGNLALRSMALGGVYIGGGIAPKIIERLKDGRFMEAFMSKGRFEGLLSEVPVNVILNPKTAFYGAAVYAARLKEAGSQKAPVRVEPR